MNHRGRTVEYAAVRATVSCLLFSRGLPTERGTSPFRATPIRFPTGLSIARKFVRRFEMGGSFTELSIGGLSVGRLVCVSVCVCVRVSLFEGALFRELKKKPKGTPTHFGTPMFKKGKPILRTLRCQQESSGKSRARFERSSSGTFSVTPTLDAHEDRVEGVRNGSGSKPCTPGEHQKSGANGCSTPIWSQRLRNMAWPQNLSKADC